MATVRDPMFWKRFSVAIKQDEEAQQRSSSSTPVKLQRAEQKHFTESWLDRENHKKARRTCICWVFWLIFFTLIAATIIIVAWLKTSGLLNKKPAPAATSAPAAVVVPGQGELPPPQWGMGLSPVPTKGT